MDPSAAPIGTVHDAFEGLQVHDGFTCQGRHCRKIFLRKADACWHMRREHGFEESIAASPATCKAQRLNQKSKLFMVRLGINNGQVEAQGSVGLGVNLLEGEELQEDSTDFHFMRSIAHLSSEPQGEDDGLDVRELPEWVVSLQLHSFPLLQDHALAKAIIRGPAEIAGGLKALRLACFYWLAYTVKTIGVLPFGIAEAIVRPEALILNQPIVPGLGATLGMATRPGRHFRPLEQMASFEQYSRAVADFLWILIRLPSNEINDECILARGDQLRDKMKVAFGTHLAPWRWEAFDRETMDNEQSAAIASQIEAEQEQEQVLEQGPVAAAAAANLAAALAEAETALAEVDEDENGIQDEDRLEETANADFEHYLHSRGGASRAQLEEWRLCTGTFLQFTKNTPDDLRADRMQVVEAVDKLIAAWLDHKEKSLVKTPDRLTNKVLYLAFELPDNTEGFQTARATVKKLAALTYAFRTSTAKRISEIDETDLSPEECLQAIKQHILKLSFYGLGCCSSFHDLLGLHRRLSAKLEPPTPSVIQLEDGMVQIRGKPVDIKKFGADLVSACSDVTKRLDRLLSLRPGELDEMLESLEVDDPSNGEQGYGILAANKDKLKYLLHRILQQVFENVGADAKDYSTLDLVL